MSGPVCYRVLSERTSPLFAEAFAKGSRGLVSDSRVLEPGSVALFGSKHLWPLLMDAQQEGRDWYYGDHAYLGPTFSSYRITKNGYQLNGGGREDYGRFAQTRLRVRPWRKSGRHVLVCLQGAPQYELFGLSLAEWLAAVLGVLTAHTDRPIRIRSRFDSRPIAGDLRDAWALVTWSSNAAVDGLLAGVPIFVTAPFAASFSMGLPDLRLIETPSLPPNREAFFARLAAAQWTFEEMASGKAWRELGGGS